MTKEQNNLIQLVALVKTIRDNSKLLNEIASIGEDEHKLEKMKKQLQDMILKAKLQNEDVESKEKGL